MRSPIHSLHLCQSVMSLLFKLFKHHVYLTIGIPLVSPVCTYQKRHQPMTLLAHRPNPPSRVPAFLHLTTASPLPLFPFLLKTHPVNPPAFIPFLLSSLILLTSSARIGPGAPCCLSARAPSSSPLLYRYSGYDSPRTRVVGGASNPFAAAAVAPPEPRVPPRPVPPPPPTPPAPPTSPYPGGPPGSPAAGT